MRRLVAPAVVGGLITLGACATRPPQAPTPGSAAVEGDAGAPRPVAGQDWRLSSDQAARRLAFGTEASDELKLALDCQAGSGRLELTAPAPAPSAALLLESGGDTERFAVVSEPLEIDEGALLTGQADAAHPVFQRFRALGWLAIWHGEERTVMPAHPSSRASIAWFFEDCG